jgi:ParB family chromosome partitioning protein
MRMELVELDIDRITTKTSLRDDLGDLTTLENSIRRLGLLFPVIVDSNNVLISGSRRLAACRNVGLTTLHALKADVDADSMDAADVQCDENLCRRSLTLEEIEKGIGRKKSIHRKQAGGLLSRARALLGQKDS